MYHFPWYVITGKWKIMEPLLSKSYLSQNKLIHLKTMWVLYVPSTVLDCGYSMNRKDKAPCVTELTLLRGMIEQKK